MSKVNMVAGEFRKVSDLQMVETTKRTIRENVTISQQLSKMSEKTMALLRENEALRRKETEMSRRVELLEASHREVTRKNVSNQKVWKSVLVHLTPTDLCVVAGDSAAAGEGEGAGEGVGGTEVHRNAVCQVGEADPAGDGTSCHYHH